MSLKSGDFVNVRVFGGAVEKRLLLRIEGEKAIITTSQEAEAAANDQREPISIGFPLSDVVDVKQKAAKPWSRRLG
jgi:hypothetical protein